jgi:single-stranded-DNA-specific exonuclease
VLARLYAARGLTDPKELSSELAAMIPPSGLLHIDAAAVFLADSIAANKRMVIVADYDCDGATACAVALRGLRAWARTSTSSCPTASNTATA